MPLSNEISVSQLRERMKAALDEVTDTRKPLRVKRRNGEDVVIIPASDYEAMDETAYLDQSPVMAQRLKEAHHRAPEDRIAFDSLADLKNAFGD